MKLEFNKGVLSKYIFFMCIVYGIHAMASAIEAAIRNWDTLWNWDTWMTAALEILAKAGSIITAYGLWHHLIVLGLVVLVFSIIKING